MADAVERLLARAATEPQFRDALLADPVAAATEAGEALTPSEESMLRAAGPEQLGLMIDQLASRGVAPAPPDEVLVASLGIRPDGPAPVPAGIRPDQTPAPQGIRPDRPDPVRGIHPDYPGPSKGIRPGRVALATAAAATLIGGGAYYLAAGNRADRPTPPATEPARDAGVDAKAPMDPPPDDE